MKTPFRSCSRPARFLGVALSLAASLFAYGAVMLPAASAAATPNPVVAQQPLTLQPSIPPNIVLMLDDSGSMNADYIPDYSSLANTSNNAMIDASNNGVYYDPTVTYLPPPQADGTLLTNQTNITSVPPNGIDNTLPSAVTAPLAPVNLTNYNGQYECDHSQNCGLNTDGSPKGHIYFSASVVGSTAAIFSQDEPSGSACTDVYNSTPNKFGGTKFNNGGDQTVTGNCTFQYYPTNHYFQYSTGPASGPYVVHYVASASQGCGGLNATTTPTCVLDTVGGDGTNGAPAPGTNGAPAGGVTVGQNIANWFAYYHTRILMAKSGLMTGTENLPSTYRFGFASINAKGVDNIPTTPTPYTFDDSTSGGGSTTNKLAVVQPFGVGTDSTSQKAKFWTWIENISPWSNTPLRKALQGVGEYFKTDQPWTSMPGDPGYVDGGTNSPLACRASYTILTTDGFWNGASPNVGNTDGTDGPTYTGPNGQSLNYTGYTTMSPYSDSYSDTLADVAMQYWETDLQPTLNNEVPPNTKDPAQWQHMVTFTMGLGVTPTGITPDGTTIDQIFNWATSGGTPDDFSWPQPASDSSNNIADLAHAAVNGHGAFFSVKSPQAFAAGIASALKRITERVGTGSSLASNSTQLTTGTVIFQANYFTATWSGDLKALSVDPVTGKINPPIKDPNDPTKLIPSPPLWTASSMLTASATAGTGGVLTYPGRDIETYNPSTGAFVAFKNGTGTAPSLSSAQLTALGGSDTTTQTANTMSMVDYLRGDNTLEQTNKGSLRDRDTPLGDIVDSQPVYSGPPNPNEFINQSFYGTTVDSTTNTVPFYDWAVGTTSAGVFTASAASKRTALVFVASNDGMLHAFNAGNYNSTTGKYDSGTGAEVYAYLPGAVITAGLKNLSDPAYGSAADPHQFYNDGQLTIADAYLPALGKINNSYWHTILVGTTGRGSAEAVYALDITDPGNITPLWERSAGDGLTGSSYIGQMVGKPVIAQTNYVPKTSSTPASSTWSVLVGNGYNSAKGVPALLQFNLATGALNVHATTDTTTGNGLAAPVAWMDNPVNSVSDVVYAGDLHGNVWKFPLNDTTGSNPTPTSTGSLLFTAKDASGNLQPITAGMLAGKDPSTSNVWLFFGTGKYLSSADLTNTNAQTWYGIIVQSATSKLVTNLANGRSALVQRTITAQTGVGGTSLPARTVSTQTVDSKAGTTDMSGKSGWYLDLLAPTGTGGAAVNQGERMVDPNQFQGSLLIGVTRIPLVTDVCNPSGSGWIMAIDPFTGAAPADDFFDVNNDGYINSSDRVSGNPAAGVGFSSLPNAPIFVGGIMETSFDNGTTSSLKTAGTVGTVKRVTWREVVNP